MSTRDRPDLMTCAPIIQMTGRPARRACTMRAATSASSERVKGRRRGLGVNQAFLGDQVAGVCPGGRSSRRAGPVHGKA